MTRRIVHSDTVRAEAIGLVLGGLNHKEVSERTGVPRTTITRWMQTPRYVEEAADPPTKEAIVAKLWEAVQVGTEAVLTGLRDDKANLGHKARALEVVAERHALLTGGVTSRSEVYGVETPDPDEEAERRLAEFIGELSFEERNELRDIVTAAEVRFLQTLLTRRFAAGREVPQLTAAQQHWVDTEGYTRDVPRLTDGSPNGKDAA